MVRSTTLSLKILRNLTYIRTKLSKMNTKFLLLGAYLAEVKSKYLAKRYQAANLQ